MKKVLVLDARQRAALAVTRTLGKHGIDVSTADETETALSGRSRYSRIYHTYPSPRTEPGAFIPAIGELCNAHDIDLLLPMTELTTTLLLDARETLNAELPFAEKSAVDALADKSRLFQLAESVGVPTPRTEYVEHPDSILASLRDRHYPLVLKPAKSWLVCQGEWVRSTVRIAHSAEQAERFLTGDPVFSHNKFMIQEYIQGYGQGVFALYDRGNPVAFFSHRRVREKPPGGGVSVLSESVPVDAEQLKHTRALLDSANWHGIAMVEYRVAADATPYLMEINTRFWGSLQLAIDAGVDFPYLLFQICSGQETTPVRHYRIGRKLRWLLGDVDNLYLTVRDRNVSSTEKISALLRFLKPAPLTTRHEVNRLNDLGPFWLELKEYLADLRS